MITWVMWFVVSTCGGTVGYAPFYTYEEAAIALQQGVDETSDCKKELIKATMEKEEVK